MKHSYTYVFMFSAIAVLATGCASGPVQGARNVSSGITAAGALGGALVGNALKKGDPLAIAAGAAGGLIAGNVGGRLYSKQVTNSFDEGYVRGQADNIKKTYWILQNSDVGGQNQRQGRTVFYTVPGPVETEDGRKQVNHTITIPVIE